MSSTDFSVIIQQYLQISNQLEDLDDQILSRLLEIIPSLTRARSLSPNYKIDRWSLYSPEASDLDLNAIKRVPILRLTENVENLKINICLRLHTSYSDIYLDIPAKYLTLENPQIEILETQRYQEDQLKEIQKKIEAVKRRDQEELDLYLTLKSKYENNDTAH